MILTNKGESAMKSQKRITQAVMICYGILALIGTLIFIGGGNMLDGKESESIAGGVAAAIEKCVKAYYPNVEVKIEHAEGLEECKKMLLLAKLGKKDGCLIEGMGCPGGCIAGAGTNVAIEKAAAEVKKFVENSTKPLPEKDLYEIELP